jgi:hypothetical protein
MEARYNLHIKDFGKSVCDFTIEFDVKGPEIPGDLPEDLWEVEYTTGNFTNDYAGRCFAALTSTITRGWRIDDWSFGGRSNGWFVLLCKGNPGKVKDQTIEEFEFVVDTFFRNYGKALLKHYC